MNSTTNAAFAASNCCISEKSTHLGKVRRELAVNRDLSNRRIEAIDEITAALKFRRAEEGRRHFNAIARLRHSDAAVIQNVQPSGETMRVPVHGRESRDSAGGRRTPRSRWDWGKRRVCVVALITNHYKIFKIIRPVSPATTILPSA